MRISRSFALTLVGIFLVAAACRLYVLNERLPMHLEGDEPDYVELAYTLMTTGEFRRSASTEVLFGGGKPEAHTAYRSPVLPAFLAAHYRVFGLSHTYPRLSLVSLSCLTCVLVALLAVELFDWKVGIVAGALWALWPTAVFAPYASDRFYPETLAIMLLVAHSLLLVRLLRSQAGTGLAMICGVCLGGAVLTRGYIALLVPLTICVAVFWWRWAPSIIAAFTVGALLVPGLWVARNYVVMGRAVLSTQTDHFYLGNNQWARGSFNGDFFVVGRESPQLKRMTELFPDFWQMTEVDRSDAWLRAAQLSIIENPQHFAWLLWRKALVFWSPLQHWRWGWYRIHVAHSILLLSALLLLWRTSRIGESLERLEVALLPVLAVFVAALATYGFDRYRYVAEPYIVVLGSAGLLVRTRLLSRDHDPRMPGARA